MTEKSARKPSLPADQTGAERASLWCLRIVTILVLLMIFFPPFNPGRISSQISGNLTLLTSATSYSTVTTKLSAYMTSGSRFALRSSDMVQSMTGCAMVLIGAILAGAGACVSLGNRKMRRIAVFFPLAGGALILGGLSVNRAAFQQITDFVNGMDLPASHIEEHLRNLSLQWPAFANTAWTAGGILLLGLVAFAVGTAGGVIMGKIMCKLSGGKINPLIGAAGVSAVPMAARVVNKIGLEEDPQNFPLMHAMGPNVSGVIGSAVAAGVLLCALGS